MGSSSFKYDESYWLDRSRRMLFARLDSVWTSSDHPSVDVLNLIQGLAESAGDDLSWIAHLHHVSRPQGAHDFVVNDLPELLRELSHATVPVTRGGSSAIKGAISWSKTIREQVRRGSQSHYVCRAPSRDYDLEENRLLKEYLRQVGDLGGTEAGRGGGRVGEKISELAEAIREVQSTAYMRSVSATKDITPRMVARASRSKKELYGRLAALWDEFDKAVNLGDVSAARELLDKGWLSPKVADDTDGLFELYVLLSVLDAVENELRSDRQGSATYHAIRPGGNVVIASFIGANWFGEVSFDRTPEEVYGSYSAGYLYKSVLGMYSGLSGVSRRPDVSIHLRSLTDPGNAIKLLIEAKNTPPSSRYLSDSIYKVLGYLKDFESLWTSTQKPKAVLVVPDGVNPMDSGLWLEQDIAIVSGDACNMIRHILHHLIHTSQLGVLDN